MRDFSIASRSYYNIEYDFYKVRAMETGEIVSCR